MRGISFIFIFLFIFGFSEGSYCRDISIIPMPAEMTTGDGYYLLKKSFKIGEAGLSPEMRNEVAKFAADIRSTTGIKTEIAGSKGNLTVISDTALPEEGYKLKIDSSGITLKASTGAGLFYGFQTLKRLFPVNVAVDVFSELPEYELPYLEISDAPRFGYRGFMLDVSRHFFDVDEIKKMLDLMAIYKLNRFHWHLTDDQGWRLPVKGYPLLTEKGAVNRNILLSNFDTQTQTRAGKDSVYGPYFYTPEQIRDIVAYAAERHIEVIPEIDMPGHMVAAIHAYPEFSTDPESKRAIAAGIDLASEPVARDVESHFTHNIWNVGGISKDVLDISKPEVISFVKAVIDEVAELFPYEYIHIGGDECPTDAWEKSEACNNLKKELGYDSYHALQTWFTQNIAAYAREKHNRKIMGWNEILTSKGANIEAVKDIDPVIFCWYPPEKSVEMCEKEGLRHVFTPFNGGYYINRAYKGFDKIGAVGDGALYTSYNHNPPENKYCVGVQGTFWTEQVDRNRDLEYLALPRLLAIAEQGWTPSGRKDYSDFLKRLKADTDMLDAGGYNFARHQLDVPESMEKDSK